MRALLALVLTLIILAPERVTATAAGQSCLPIAEAGSGLTLTGPGSMNTPPFELAAGSYHIQWTATRSAGPMPGNVLLTVPRVDGAFYAGMAPIVNAVVSQGQATASGETYLYGVKAGAHYLTVMSPGEWSVTLTPIS